MHQGVSDRPQQVRSKRVQIPPFSGAHELLEACANTTFLAKKLREQIQAGEHQNRGRKQATLNAAAQDELLPTCSRFVASRLKQLAAEQVEDALTC